MMLLENKEIIYKTLIVIGSISLSIGVGNYLYNYYKNVKKYNDGLKKYNENNEDKNNEDKNNEDKNNKNNEYKNNEDK